MPYSNSTGIRVASSQAASAHQVVADLKRALMVECEPLRDFIPRVSPFAHFLLFYSAGYVASELAASMAEVFPDVPVSGCSTAGEIATGGMSDSGVVLVAFFADHFRIHAGLIEGVGSFAVERAADVVGRLQSKLRQKGFESSAKKSFAIMLVDGLSNAEEMVVAAVHWAVGDVQLVGGSAGDSLAFSATSLIYEGRVVHNAALLIMAETDVPFRVFKTQNFEPTAAKFVVTAADTERRIVYELNAEPAAREYASAIGLMPDDLGPFSFASHPLVVKIGGDYYCRSIRNMNEDGSLTFFCAIDEGLVFTVAEPQDMLRSTAKTLDGISAELGGTEMILGFDCILRRLDAENRQIRHEVEELYRRHKVTGFHTYGEQYNAMHLNQTLTGIAFGSILRTPARGGT